MPRLPILKRRVVRLAFSPEATNKTRNTDALTLIQDAFMSKVEIAKRRIFYPRSRWQRGS
jgi:hypothetical protein